MNEWQVFNELNAALSYTGILYYGTPTMDKWYRCPTEGHPRNKNGAVLVCSNGVILLWNWENDEKAIFNPNANRKFTKEEKAEFWHRVNQATVIREKEEQQRVEAGAIKAQKFLQSYCHPFQRLDCHAYLESKHVGSYECDADGNYYLYYVEGIDYKRDFYGLADSDYCWLLVLPITNGKEVISLEFISDTGGKQFFKSAAYSGGYWVAYKTLNRYSQDARIFIAEGAATLLSIVNVELHRNPHANLLAVAALSCYNLLPVAINLRNRYQGVPIYVFGDNDKSEAGQKAAKNLQNHIPNCKVAIPDFSVFSSEELAAFKQNNGDKAPSDWNDYYIIKEII